MPPRGLGLPSSLNFSTRLGKEIICPLPVDQLRKAAIIVADNSNCTDDCAELLEILGIDIQEIQECTPYSEPS